MIAKGTVILCLCPEEWKQLPVDGFSIDLMPIKWLTISVSLDPILSPFLPVHSKEGWFWSADEFSHSDRALCSWRSI